MKRINNVWSKITDIENIKRAHQKARQDKTYYREVKMVDDNPDYYLNRIRDMLINHTYVVSDYTVQIINDKGKERELMKLQYFPDRIIQWAIMLQIENMFIKTFCHHTCSSIPNRGNKKVYSLMTTYLKDKQGTKYCLQFDIKKFYPSISHSKLKNMLRKKIKDNDLLWLLDLIIDSYPGDYGLPIGSYLSQYLANFYLSYFDHYIKEDLRIKYAIRFMDDYVIFANSKELLHTYFYKIGEYLNDLELTIKSNYQIYRVNVRGVAFIGYRYFRHFILISKKTLKRMKLLCRAILSKQSRKELISFRQWSGINSYIGCLKWCNSYKLKSKYIKPILTSIKNYYWYNIASKKRGTKLKSMRKYCYKLYHNLYLCIA